MNTFLLYWFHLNPGYAFYQSPKSLALMGISLALVLGSFGLRFWRSRITNPVTRKLSRSWSTAALWFGLVGLFLVVCRVELISFFAMRAWWIVWVVALVIYVALQYRIFRARHYEIVPQEKKDDPRDRYLPKRKK